MARWFNLKTTRGWIQTAGALVMVVGSIAGAYFQVQATDEPTKNPEAAGAIVAERAAPQSGTAQQPDTKPQGSGIGIRGVVTAQNGAVVIGSQPVSIEIGYSIEQHKQRLAVREQELRGTLQARPELSEEHRKTIDRELQAVQSQLRNLQASYQEALAELKRLARELGVLRGQVPDPNLREALDAAGQGKMKESDALFAEVENRAQQSIELAARAAFERGRIAYHDVRWREALTHFEKADRLIPDHGEYSHWAARSAHDLGDYDTAARRYEAILERLRKKSGEHAPELGPASNNLAFVHQDQGRYAEAEPLFKKVVAIGEKALPPDHPDLVTGYTNLAVAYQAQGRFDEAEPLFKKAIAISEKTLPADHPDLATAYNSLALLYRVQIRPGEAEPLFKKALAISEKALPADHPTLAIRYNGLGLIFWAQDRYGEAEPLFRKAIAIGEKALPADHPSLATWYNNLALTYRDQGRYGEAESLLKKAIAISEKALPADHPSLATWYNNLALVYHAQDRFDEAEPLYRRALEVMERTLGPDHWKTGQVARHYAELHKRQGRPAEADALLRRIGGQ